MWEYLNSMSMKENSVTKEMEINLYSKKNKLSFKTLRVIRH